MKLFVIYIGALTLLYGCSNNNISNDEKPPINRVNILHIITNQQTAFALSCAGNNYIKTPNLDALAAQGIRFEKAYTAYPVCFPNRASMLTGLVSSECSEVKVGDNINNYETMIINKVEVKKWTVPELKEQSVGWLMKDVGYDVAYAGKWHSGKDLGIPPDHDYEYLSGEGGYYGGQAERVTKPSLDFLDQKRNIPFYLTASYIQPHGICFWGSIGNQGKTWFDDNIDPWDYSLKGDEYPFPQPDPKMSIKEFIKKYCPPLPDNYYPPNDECEAYEDMRAKRGFMSFGKGELGKSLTEEEYWQLYRWTYFRLVEQADQHVGELLTGLKERGLYENTLIIFTSDHGDNSAAHQLRLKGTTYEESVHVPFFAILPGVIKSGVDTTHFINNGVDFLPTCLDYAGAKLPKRTHGRSLRPLFEGEKNKEWCTYVYSETILGCMIRTYRYKYVNCSDPKRPKFAPSIKHPEMFFDLQNDPGEMNNLIYKSDYKELIGEHRILLANELKRIKK